MSNTTSNDKTLVVTDSTASLPWQSAQLPGLAVVNLHVIHNGTSYEENVDVAYEQCATWVASHEPLLTSQPTKQAFVDCFNQALAQGYSHVVCCVISSELSGTYDTAVAAAREVSIPVEVIDSLTSGMALGAAVLNGLRAAHLKEPSHTVAHTIRESCNRAGALFMVDSLDHLRRGGRLSAPAAALGTVLGMKPILELTGEGTIGVAAKVRSRAAALNYLFDHAIARGQEVPSLQFGVHYFGDDTRAHQFASRIEQALGTSVRVSPLSTVLGVHVGPGAIALTYA